MAALDTTHTFAFKIKPYGSGWTDYWSYVRKPGPTVSDVEGAEIDTLSIELEDYAGTLSLVEWSECYLQVDGSTYLFYGYITKIKPRVAKSGQLIYELRCESSAALLRLAKKVNATYINQTFKYIVGALFTLAETAGWDVTTYVSTGPTIASFSAVNEELPALMDRLCQLATVATAATWAWRCEENKVLRAGATTSTAAPFGIAELASANYTTTFPPLGEPDVERDGSLLINRVTVRGKNSISADTTETFSGDGSTIVFQLAHMAVKEIAVIKVGTTLQAHGVQWYNTFAEGYPVLVNYGGGVLNWEAGHAPAVGVNNISCTYRYSDPIVNVYTDAASYTKYGMYFDLDIRDESLTDEGQAEELALAVLDTFANGLVSGTFDVARYGLRAGQDLNVSLPTLGINANYPIRRVQTVIDKAGSGVVATVTFGGQPQRLSEVINQTQQAQDDNYAQAAPSISGEGGIVRMRGRIELLDPLTVYTEP